jgi:hypothetical protein
MLFLPDGQGEFIISESQGFLRAVAPYVRRVSKVLAALGPVTALLAGANPVVAMTPAVALALAQWAKEYQTPVRHLAELLVEENAEGHQGMVDTGNRPVQAEKEGLLWLHNYLREDPARRSKLGLVCKPDREGRRWWVLPQVEV